MSSWILLRGLTRESAHWGGFLPAFAERMAPKAVHALDLPGNGTFHRARSPWSVGAMVAACRAHAAQQGWPRPYHLLAMSLGGMVAIDWARTAPEDVGSCVLINTSLGGFSPLHHRLRPGNYSALLRLVASPGSALDIERTVLRLTANHAPNADAVIAHWAAVRAQRPVSVANAVRQLMAAARFRAPATPPPVPTLLLASRQDHLVNARCSQAIAARWGCPLRWHATAGHDLPLDDAQWVVDEITAWYQSGPSRPGA